ncbi:MAG: hypothetical protein JJE17_11855 [Peptostreptococcaceae bacterium]|nr:hypothetical protein [Peptostreptococcaceae bacterium]
MKRKISVFLITLLFVSSFLSCGIVSNDKIRNDQIETGVLEEYNNLINASKNFTSVEKFDNYLLKWANKRDIKASYDNYENVIMSKAPAAGYENGNSINIQTSIGLTDMEERCLSIAMSLFVIENVPENNFMRIIFTNNDKGDFSGAKGINSRYLFADYQINLDWSYDKEKDPPEFTIINGSAGTTINQMSQALQYVDSNYSKAYEISIKDLNGGDSNVLSVQHPNPIKIIGDLLASCKSSGILFELGSFNGGSSPGTYPTNASITLVINDNDISKFTRKVKNSQNEFNSTYGDKEENYTYSITEINPLDQVLKLENTDSIVSLLYTLIDKVYLRDEETEETVATSNIGQISTLNNEFKLIVCGRSVEKDGMNQLKDSYSIIASLSGMNYSLLAETPIWEAKDDNEILKAVTVLGKDKYGIEPKILRSFAETENAYFVQNKYLINIISIKVNLDNYITQTQLLLDIIKGKKSAVS